MAQLNKNSLLSLFAKSDREVDELLEVTRSYVTEEVNKIHSIKPEKRTYANTVRAFDSLASALNRVISAVSLGVYTYPNDDLRQSCFGQTQKLIALLSDLLMD